LIGKKSMSKKQSEMSTRLKELSKKLDAIRTEGPSSPVKTNPDAVEDFLQSKHNAQKIKLVHLQDLFNEHAHEDGYIRVKEAMDFAETYVKDFASIAEVNPNGAMKKQIAIDLFNSYPSNYAEDEKFIREMSRGDVSDLIEVLINVSKGECKFNNRHDHAEAEPETKQKHSKIGTWNLARKNALGKH